MHTGFYRKHMNKSQRYFTHTIVGQPERYVLGQHVRFDRDPDLGGDGAPEKVVRWFGRLQTSCADRLRSMQKSAPIRISTVSNAHVSALEPKAGRHGMTVRVAVVAVPALIAAGAFAQLLSTWYQEYQLQPERKVVHSAAEVLALPLSEAASAPQSQPLEAITVFDEPSNVPDDIGPAPMPLPIAKGLGEASVGALTKAPVVQTAKQAGQAPTRPAAQVVEKPKNEVAGTPIKLSPSLATPAPSQGPVKGKDDESKSAVVLDVPKAPVEEKSQKSKPSVPITVDPSPPVTRRFSTPTEINPPPLKEAPVAPQKAAEVTVDKTQKPSGQRVTVVDLAPDGSYALVTNPETRLPQKLKIGEKIYTGETIQKIEPKTGKLVLDSRTIYME